MGLSERGFLRPAGFGDLCQWCKSGARTNHATSRRTVSPENHHYTREQRRLSNIGRREIFGLTQPQIAFVCECERSACYETVLLTAAEYDALRPGPVVTPAHASAAA